MKIIFSLLGLYFGALVDGFEGAVYGFFIGLLGGALVNANTRFRRLEQRLETLAGEAGRDTAATAAEPHRHVPPGAQPESSAAATPPEPAAPESARQRPEPQPAADESRAGNTAARPVAATKPSLHMDDPISRAIRRFLTGGNLVVKVGVIILFFGVSFLIKYAAEQGLVPIELRLSGIAAGAIALLVFGWRLRLRTRGYALVIQGAGIGILYLTVFASARLYGVIPMGPAFVLLLALVALSTLLAILQDARALAFFGTAGGFLAPVLTSTGQGSHVHLFSYYLLLNGGIVAIAWFRAWRELNLLGFAFTFVIASLWGWRYYQPEHFATTEPFLIAFFLFYLAIPVLFALRQPPRLKGLVDGTLIFGVPLVAFALQTAMVEDIPMGTAWSAIAVAAVYLLLASLLWRLGQPATCLLCEAFLALGVLFTSLSVPLALDGNWTAAVWSLEGAALVWVAIRQQRLYLRAFGLLLQFAAALAFILRASAAPAEIPVLNSACIGSLLISLGGFGVGYLYHRYRDQVSRYETALPLVLMIWGLAWWLAAGLVEIDRFLPGRYELNTGLLFMTATAVMLMLLGRWLQWPLLTRPPALLLPVMILSWLWLRLDHGSRYPFDYLGWLAWPLAFMAHYFILYRAETSWPEKPQRHWHQAGFVFLVYLFAWLLNDAVATWLGQENAWSVSIWALVPFAAIVLLPVSTNYLRWPLQRHADGYQGITQWPLWLWLAVWILVTCGYHGGPSPLPYIPLLNPVELMQWLSLLLLLRMVMAEPVLKQHEAIRPGLAILAFLVLNSMAARSVHFYAGVRFNPDALLASGLFHTVISILWTLLALIVMNMATRRHRRRLWFIGAGLLGAVVLKLFSIDLADIGAMTRIVSFISVGVLILLIGYLAPVPPRAGVEPTS